MHSRLCIVSSTAATLIKIQHQDMVYVDFEPAVEPENTVETIQEDSSTKVYKFAEGTYGVLRYSYMDTAPFTVTVDGDENALISQQLKADLPIMRKGDVNSLVRMYTEAFNSSRVDEEVYPS